MTSTDAKRAIRDFMAAHPGTSYTTALRLSQAPRRFAVADVAWDSESEMYVDWLAEPSTEEVDFDADGTISDSLAGVLPGVLTYFVMSDARRESEEERYILVEMVVHEDRWLVWRRRPLTDALGPDFGHALALHRSVTEWKFQSDPNRDDYCVLDELMADRKMAWDTDHAQKALALYAGQEWPLDDWLGGDQLPRECQAVLARFLIGRYPCWTQWDYDQATFNYRATFGPLHPDDLPTPRIDVTRDIQTEEDWYAYCAKIAGVEG